MEIRKVNENKKQFLTLLLLADEQEDMVDRYLEKGAMYVLDDCGVKAECVITDEGDGILEIKNIAVQPEHQRAGYGRALIDFIVRKYRRRYSFTGWNGRQSSYNTVLRKMRLCPLSPNRKFFYRQLRPTNL